MEGKRTVWGRGPGDGRQGGGQVRVDSPLALARLTLSTSLTTTTLTTLFFFSSESGTGTKTAEECQEACKKRKGCNAWLFCASLDGCAPGPGDTCEAHLAAGKLASRFGTFGAKGGDVDPCVGEDHARYPPLMCALKKVPDTANPIINDP